MRSPTRDKIDGREVAECPEGGEQRADQIEVRQQRKGDMEKTTDAGRSVNLRRVVDVAGNHHPRGEENHGPERHPFPDIRDDVRSQAEPAGIESEGYVDSEQLR